MVGWDSLEEAWVLDKFTLRLDHSQAVYLLTSSMFTSHTHIDFLVSSLL